MRTALIVTALGIASLACNELRNNESATRQGPLPTTAQATPIKAWTDAQVLATMLAIHQGEVDIANAALLKLTNEDARDFADFMTKTHSAAVRELNSIAAEQHISPLDNDTSLQLKRDTAVTTTSMAADTPSASFDRAYITAQVDSHRKVLQIIDDDLVANATNALIKNTIQDMHTSVARHVTMAESVLHRLPPD